MPKHFILKRIPTRPDEGPFWGNGWMGAVLYVQGRRLHFTVDHAALWEMRDLSPQEPAAAFSEICADIPAYQTHSTKLMTSTELMASGVGRMRLPGLPLWVELPAEVTAFYADTDLEKARTTLRLELSDRTALDGEVWLDSNTNVLRLTLNGTDAPKIISDTQGWNREEPALQKLSFRQYPDAVVRRQKQCLQLSQIFSGDRAVVLTVSEDISRGSRYAFAASLSVGEAGECEKLQREDKARTAAHLTDSPARFQSHECSWQRYWSRFSLNIPNQFLQEAVDLERYKLFCNERPDAMPVTLQGVWNPDDRMPPWYGDLHNDLNVQACYWAAMKTGNAELARPYVDYYAAAIPHFQERAEKLFGISGAIHVPLMMAPDGSGAAAEWCFWNCLLGSELFVAVDFCWFYEYSGDLRILREKILPFLRGTLTLYRGIAREDGDGTLHIPATSSPEIFSKHMHEDSTFVLSSLHYLSEKCAAYAALAGEDAAQWSDFGNKLAPVPTSEKGYPLFDGVEVYESHRHFCHMFPVFPLSYDSHSDTANRSLDTLVNFGMLEFASWSYPYASLFASRCGRGNMARTLLMIYCMAFRAPNSFTVNGDPYRNGIVRISQTSAGERADALTLEGGLIVPAAVCEMLAHRAGDTVYLLSGIPDEWEECSCDGLTVEGSHRISLHMENSALRQVKLQAGRTERLGFQFSHAASAPTFFLQDVPLDAACTEDGRYFVDLREGQTLSVLFGRG